jgi:hypothetical protein
MCHHAVEKVSVDIGDKQQGWLKTLSTWLVLISFMHQSTTDKL